jgi:hypothetical protein
MSRPSRLAKSKALQVIADDNVDNEYESPLPVRERIAIGGRGILASPSVSGEQSKGRGLMLFVSSVLKSERPGTSMQEKPKVLSFEGIKHMLPEDSESDFENVSVSSESGSDEDQEDYDLVPSDEEPFFPVLVI